jgi:hypothetical protein
MLPLCPDFGMVFHHGVLIDGKRKKKVGVKLLYVGFHLAQGLCFRAVTVRQR